MFCLVRASRASLTSSWVPSLLKTSDLVAVCRSGGSWVFIRGSALPSVGAHPRGCRPKAGGEVFPLAAEAGLIAGMMEILISIVVLLLLITASVFATAEMAFVSARRSRLRQLAADGSGNARVALELVESPNRFLSTVQVGITLIGIVAGAFGGAQIAAQLAVPLNKVEWLAPYSGPLSFVVVVSIITFLSLVIGELVPKRVARNLVKLALLLARPMKVLLSTTVRHHPAGETPRIWF